MKKRNFNLIVTGLIIIEVISVFLMYKSHSNKYLEDKKIINDTNNKLFAAYKQTDDGYEKYHGSSFNLQGYYLNIAKSECVDIYDNEIEGVLKLDENNNVNIESNVTVYCTLYYDYDEIPVIDEFYFEDTHNEELTTEKNNLTYHLSWSNDDINNYCVTQNNDSSNCSWHSVSESEKSVSSSVMITGYGEHYYHAYIKDKGNNVSDVKSVKIIYEKTSYNGNIEGLLTYDTDNLKNTSESELYRYFGLNPNNYICFGTNDLEICKSETNKYLYRIIGITDAWKLKLIKAESMYGYEWNNTAASDTCGSDGSNCRWTKSTLFQKLSGDEFYNGIPSNWQNKIDAATWFMGDIPYEGYTDGKTVYTNEKKVTESNGKIGLMYLSDYYYAVDGTGNSQCARGCQSWLTPSADEWTMDRYGDGPIYNSYQAYCIPWYINSSGQARSLSVPTSTFAIRPVFYVSKDVTITSGNGTKNKPFLLSIG